MRLTADRVHAALRGTRPSWWDGPEPLAYGPFAVEYGGGLRVGVGLAYEDDPAAPPAGLLVYSDGERAYAAPLTRDPWVDGQKIFLRTSGGRATIRPLRASDRAWLLGPGGAPVEGADVAAAARRAFNW